MNVQFHLHYYTQPGQFLAVTGSNQVTGLWQEEASLPMQNLGDGHWELNVEMSETGRFEYHYLVRENGNTIRQEWGEPHQANLPAKTHQCTFFDFWQAEPDMRILYSSAYTESLLAVEKKAIDIEYAPNHIVLKVNAPFIRRNQIVGISGDSGVFGGWRADKALPMQCDRFGEWSVSINANDLPMSSNYKFVILEKEKGRILYYEWGEPRTLITPKEMEKQLIMHSGMTFRFQEAPWKGAGVAIPVFSLRTENSWGIGDFCDLKKMVDWAVATGQQLIQTLPVNDTTLTETWQDSYPYKAISNYALHPIYCSIYELPTLNDKTLMQDLESKRLELNVLPEIDYEAVLSLKWKYFKLLFNQEGEKTLDSSAYKDFFQNNRDWLKPYAAFCYLRWKTGKTNVADWGRYATYDAQAIETLTDPKSTAYPEIAIHYYLQYQLHKQLKASTEYARKHGVILKGDIPIGINRLSVEAWTEPELFNMDAQVGAPPDEFSETGQNWGFPSYNWDQIKATHFAWWKNRFSKMADYFDAYRIDHILGFFRIWEIPVHSVEGLLGHFSPALPITPSEMVARGFFFDQASMTKPFITEQLLSKLFGEKFGKATKAYLKKGEHELFDLLPKYDTQQKIRAFFGENPAPEKAELRNKLYSLCNEVLFVEDPHQAGYFHPRISAFTTERFRQLDSHQKEVFTNLYNDFFFVRNLSFWQEKAMEKLPELLHSTRMMSCGEDLGMRPDCVPIVMNNLGILSLEIQRMPKARGEMFGNLNNVPYLSVCTTSTHDMNPIRGWWLEDRQATQQYYNQMLWKPGEAPAECTPDMATLIVENHLASPAIWVILPWQDWMATDGHLRNPDPTAERINIPSDPHHYWRYRMHLSLEKLLKEKVFNAKIKEMVGKAGR